MTQENFEYIEFENLKDYKELNNSINYLSDNERDMIKLAKKINREE